MHNFVEWGKQQKILISVIVICRGCTAGRRSQKKKYDHTANFFRVRGARCDTCHKMKKRDQITLSVCKSCGFSYYCSETCQRKDFGNHVYSGECELFQKGRLPPNDNVRFLLRFLLKLRIHEDENNLENHEAQLSIVDKVPWKKELRSFR